MHQALVQIGIVLDVLPDLGMTVNLTRSVVLLRLSGRQSKTLKKKLLVKTNSGFSLRIPRANGHTMLPVILQHTNLGIEISYFQFEPTDRTHCLCSPSTVAHSKAHLSFEASYWFLGFVHSFSALACIHGLQATGLTSTGALRHTLQVTFVE